jgi:UDP-N-acetylmuramoyl-tripeptide--D-alanyl-D-alanine ligase
MIREVVSLYLPSYPKVLVYMLQSSEYQTGPYLAWIKRTKDFSAVMRRRQLEPTRPARLLLLALRLGMLAQIAAGFLIAGLGIWRDMPGGPLFGAAVVISYPFIWAYLAVVPLILGRELSARPRERRAVDRSEAIFARHPGIRIAVAGSYGKTTMKELLNTVLSEGLKVAATPANKNVSISHARFAAALAGDEDVLIIEYGEGEPGDVARFARLTHPTHAVITGLAAAHLDRYKTIRAAGEDIFSVANHLKAGNVYVNGESPEAKPFLKKSYDMFDEHGALGWKTTDVKSGLDGTRFTLKKGARSLKLKTGLLGRHQLGFISLAAALALRFGLTEEQVRAGVAKTGSFEHRMQPYQLSGAWVIDDTYNGNLEGIRAGTRLLKELGAKRKIYVTPGLVDQGEETAGIHREVGRLIAAAKPDLVVLMRNSVTGFIQEGLKAGGFKGELRVEADPLNFYTNLNHFVASGDLVVMQNDWTDNYV